MSKDFMIGVGFLIAGVVLGIALVMTIKQTPTPCKAYANAPISQLPARCVTSQGGFNAK